MPTSSQPVALIIGTSRGIGRRLAIDFAANNYHVVVSAKTTSDASSIPASEFPPDPNSSASTINTVAREISEAGHNVTAIPVNTRDEESIQALISETYTLLGRIDVLIYNSGAIWWSAVETTPLKRYKLMHEVNSQGLYATIQACFPVWKKTGWKCRIIVVSPPIYSRFFHGKTAYAMTKVGMSIMTKGLAVDFERQGHKDMAITSIWPAVAIESAATEVNAQLQAQGIGDRKSELRKPEIYSDAILAMIRADPKTVNGLLDTDEDFLRRVEGYTDADFDKYARVPGSKPRRIMPLHMPTLDVAEQDDEGHRMDSVVLRKGRL